MKNTNRGCGADSCERPHYAKGHCKLHYTRLALTGRLTRPSAVDRFWVKVDTTGDCWIWNAMKDRNGYGMFLIDGRQRGAHRVAYELEYAREAPPVLDHICHQRDCVRPSHLRSTTQKQNTENRKAANTNSASGVRGVIQHRQTGKWKVTVTHQGKAHHGGFYTDLIDADRAARTLRNKLFTHNNADRMATR